jgi:hypothetical protein
MTTAIRSSVPPHRRRAAAFPRCVTPRGACPSPEGGRNRRKHRTRLALLGAALASVLFAAPAAAQSGPRAACLAATRAAEAQHNLPPGLMVAIALAESGMHAHALNIGGRAHYPTDPAEARRLLLGAPSGASIMAGCVQVNARVHARGADWPLDAMRAADWGARLLRTHYDRTGDWAEALRRWNGGQPATRNRLVCRVQAKLLEVEPANRSLSGVDCGRPDTVQRARVRQDGRIHLAAAEAGR